MEPYFEAILPVTEFLLANGPAFEFAHKEWINLMQWIAGAPLDPEMDHLRESKGPLAERLRLITPPHDVPEKKWWPFIATAMSAAKQLVLRPAELKTTAVSMPLTMDSNGGSGQQNAVVTMEEPQELTIAAVLSLLPSIGVTLDNSGTENRRGVAHAQLPEKSVQNCEDRKSVV